MSEYDLLGELNRAAGTTSLGFSAACNALAGTTGLEGVGALNVLAGTTGKDLDGVLAYIVGRPGLGANAAARLVGVNLLSTNAATVETDTTGLGPLNLCTVARSTTKAKAGVASLALTCTGGGITYGGVDIPGKVAVRAGVTYTAVVSSSAGTTGRSSLAAIMWLDSGSAFLTTSTGSTTTNGTGGWTDHVIAVAAPAGAAYACPLLGVASPAADEVHYADQFGIWSGVRTSWVAPGG